MHTREIGLSHTFHAWCHILGGSSKVASVQCFTSYLAVKAKWLSASVQKQIIGVSSEASVSLSTIVVSPSQSTQPI